MKAGIYFITETELKKLLGWPNDVRIIGVNRGTSHPRYKTFNIEVEFPDELNGTIFRRVEAVKEGEILLCVNKFNDNEQ